MASIGRTSVAGNDLLVLVLNGVEQIMTDLGNGNSIMLEPTDDRISTVVGKNRSYIIANNANGDRYNLTIRAVIGGSSDVALNQHFTTNDNLGAGKILVTGRYIKSYGDGLSGIAQTLPINLQGFELLRRPTSYENTEGETDQLIREYVLQGLAFYE